MDDDDERMASLATLAPPERIEELPAGHAELRATATNARVDTPTAVGAVLARRARFEPASRDLEAHMEATGLDPRQRDMMRGMWHDAQDRRALLLRESGCSDWDEFDLRQQEADAAEAMAREVPFILRDATFASTDLREPAQVARDWMQVELLPAPRYDDDEPHPVWLAAGMCLVLAGETGTGKSWAAAACMRRFAEAGRSFAWRYAPDMLQDIERDMGGWEKRQMRHTRAATVPVLVIDDLGAELDDRRTRGRIDSLVYHRHANRRTTIVTTNLGAHDLAERYGRRVVDRLREWGVSRAFGGESIRTPLARAAGWRG